MRVSVLVIDDDPVFRGLARRMLDAVGLHVVGEAESYTEGLAEAQRLRPTAALIDVGLPDGNGVALAEQLSALPWSVRMLLTSTDPDAVSEEDVGRSGAGAFVAKDKLPNAPLKRLLSDG
jgi:DNA-binding NarL/FixJ family response regulator